MVQAVNFCCFKGHLFLWLKKAPWLLFGLAWIPLHIFKQKDWGLTLLRVKSFLKWGNQLEDCSCLLVWIQCSWGGMNWRSELMMFVALSIPFKYFKWSTKNPGHGAQSLQICTWDTSKLVTTSRSSYYILLFSSWHVAVVFCSCYLTTLITSVSLRNDNDLLRAQHNPNAHFFWSIYQHWPEQNHSVLWVSNGKYTIHGAYGLC